MSNLDPHQCPICKGPNDCGVAFGAGTCWCFAIEKPAEKVLEKIPREAVNFSCICRWCARQEKSPHALAEELKSISKSR